MKKLPMLYRVVKRGSKYCVVLSIGGVNTMVGSWYNTKREAVGAWNKKHNEE